MQCNRILNSIKQDASKILDIMIEENHNFSLESFDSLFRPEEVKKLSFIALTGFLATAINPHGWEYWLYPYHAIVSSGDTQFISEWQSPSFHKPFFQYFLVVVFLFFMNMICCICAASGAAARGAVEALRLAGPPWRVHSPWEVYRAIANTFAHMIRRRGTFRTSELAIFLCGLHAASRSMILKLLIFSKGDCTMRISPMLCINFDSMQCGVNTYQ